jgi:hypothetical protein
MIKCIIAGGRDFNNYDLLYNRCKFHLKKYGSDVQIVSGGARGADTLGEKFATDMGYSIKQFPADWSKYGKSAGYRRNAQMSEYADMLIAFWDYNSRGTQHMINLAKAQKLTVIVIKY